MAAHRFSPEGGMARFIGGGAREPAYYLVAPFPCADYQVLRFLTPGKQVRDVPNVMEDLGRTIDTHRDAVFVLHPDLADAAIAIRRCYPSAGLAHESSGISESPVLALVVSAAAVAAGRNCEAPGDGPGLRARYFSGIAWDGDLRLEQTEDWPLRFVYDVQSIGSAEWSGQLQIPVGGLYRFQLYTEPAAVAQAEIDGVGALVNGDMRDATLEAGSYPLTIRCSPARADSFCWLRWRPPAGAWGAIPPQFLWPQ
jgi:hypothetical protein